MVDETWLMGYRLTLALMGSDDLNLRVLATSSDDPRERKQAQKVIKLLARGRHWVLVVLLLSNVVRWTIYTSTPDESTTDCSGGERNFTHLPRRRPGWWTPSRRCLDDHDCHFWRSYPSSRKPDFLGWDFSPRTNELNYRSVSDMV